MLHPTLLLARAQISAFVGSYRASFEGLPRTALTVATIAFVNNAGRTVSTFLALYLLSELYLSAAWIGVIVAVYGAGSMVGSLIGGWLCSRTSSRAIMGLSLLCSGAGFISLAAVADPWAFLALVFLSASFEGGVRPPMLLLLLDSAAPSDRPRCYAVYQTAMNLGYAVGAAAGGLVASLNFSLIFMINGLTSFMAAAAALTFLPHGRNETSAAATAQEESSNATWRRSSFAVLCAVILFNYSVANQRLSTYPLYLTADYGLDTASFGALLMVNSLLIALATIAVADKLKQFDQRWIAGLGSLLLCGSFALLPAGSTIEFALLTCLVLTAGEILFMPAIVSLVYIFSRRGSAGTSLGIFYSINSICRSLGPAAGMWLMGTIGSLGLWLACGLVGLATLLVLPNLKSTGQPSRLARKADRQ